MANPRVAAVMTTPSLFDLNPPPRLPYQRGSDTSQAAAEAIQPYADIQRERVFWWVVGCGVHGATMKEAEAQMPIKRASACPRFNELQKRWVTSQGTAGLMKTTRRRDKCAVYVGWMYLTEAGQ